MEHKGTWKISAVLLGLLLWVLTGCVGQASAPTRFYMLKPIEGSEIKLKFAERDRCTIVGMAPIEFPAYLDRPQFIIQKGKNEYRLAEFDHWAEPLRSNFERVFFENLNILLNDVPVAVVRQASSLGTNYQLRMGVIRMESDQKGQVTLDAGWIILGDEGRKLILAKVSRYREQSGSEDYVEIVAAQSRALEALSREIAGEIRDLL